MNTLPDWVLLLRNMLAVREEFYRNGCNCSEKCTSITRKKCPFGQLLGGFAPKNGGSQQVKHWELLLRIMQVGTFSNDGHCLKYVVCTLIEVGEVTSDGSGDYFLVFIYLLEIHIDDGLVIGSWLAIGWLGLLHPGLTLVSYYIVKFYNLIQGDLV